MTNYIDTFYDDELKYAITEFPRITYYLDENIKSFYRHSEICCYEEILNAVKKYNIYKHLSKKIHNNFSITLAAMESNMNCQDNIIPYISNYLKRNPDFIFRCIQLQPNIIFKIPQHMNNEILLLETIKYEPSYFIYFDENYKCDSEFLIKCLFKNKNVYDYFNDEVKKNTNIKIIYDEISYNNKQKDYCCFCFNLF